MYFQGMKLPKIFKRHLAVFSRRYLQVEVIISVFQPPKMKKRYRLSFYISVIRFKIYFYCLVLFGNHEHGQQLERQSSEEIRNFPALFLD